MRRLTCRWLPMALVALCVTVPAPSWALGLGELEVESALNERFSGSIQVLDADGYGQAEIVVSLASREDFERVGVERFFYLTNLQFAVEIAANGAATVNVSSAAPISEPYLNFIVEVLWPKGRLLKEFTVLLDPPTYSEVAAPAVRAPVQPDQQAAATPDRTERPASAGTRVQLADARSESRAAPAVHPMDNADGLMTTRNDTLWSIASATRASGRVSVQQQMLAIQRLNPEAFLRDNINLLKAGYVLEIPSESQALELEQSQALADVAAQTRAWRNSAVAQTSTGETGEGLSRSSDSAAATTRSQVDATQAAADSDSALGQSNGQVRIVANTGELASGTASGDDPTVTQLIEEKETLARQVDELTYQLDREKEIAGNQVTVKDRQIEVKDQEIAQLQEQLKAQREALQALRQNQNQSPAAQVPETPWWMSPMVLGGAGTVLILLLAFGLISARRKRNAQAYSGAVVDTAPGIDLEPASDDAAEELDDDVFDDLDGDTEQASNETGATRSTATTAGETGDVIGEAEIYVAYGRYGQAVALLSGVLVNEPDRHDVRLKLMEVFVEAEDPEGFAEQEQYLIDHCEDADVLDAAAQLKQQINETHLDMSDDIADVTQADTDAETAIVDVESGAAADEALVPQLDDDFELDLDAVEDSADSALVLSQEADDESVDEFLEETIEDTVHDAVDDVLELDDAPDQAAKLDEAEDEFRLEFDTATDADGGQIDTAMDDDAPVLTDDAADDDLLELDELESLDLDESGDNVVEFSNAPADDDDFSFDADEGADVNATKLDLAEAYIDMGDADGAQDILREVVEEGTDEQREKAERLLKSIA